MVLLSARKTAKIKEETLRAKLALPAFSDLDRSTFPVKHLSPEMAEPISGLTTVQLHQVPICLNSVPLLKMAGSSQKVQRPFLWFLSTTDTRILLFNSPRNPFT